MLAESYHSFRKVYFAVGYTARRDYADAVKAMKKDNPQALKTSVASQGLKRIATIYALEGALSDLSAEERLQERQKRSRRL